MKRKIIIGVISFIVLLSIVLVGAGNYFYSVAIKRSVEPVDLYGGKDDAQPASAMVQEEEQRKLEELMKWTEEHPADSLEIISEDGLNLKADFLQNENSTGKAVIIAHGYKGNSTQMPGISQYYYMQGYDVLRPDARGHGRSEGDYVGYGWHERKDYKKWIQLLIQEKNIDTIVLHGFSMGAATVLMTSGEELPLEVKAIVADSGYTTVHEELSHQLKYMYKLPAFPLMEVTSAVTKMRAGYSFKEASAIEQVKNNKLPLFIIHGDQDNLVPTDMGYEIYDAATSEKELWIVPGAGHTEGYTVAEEEYKQRLTDFLNKALN